MQRVQHQQGGIVLSAMIFMALWSQVDQYQDRQYEIQKLQQQRLLDAQLSQEILNQLRESQQLNTTYALILENSRHSDSELFKDQKDLVSRNTFLVPFALPPSKEEYY